MNILTITGDIRSNNFDFFILNPLDLLISFSFNIQIKTSLLHYICYIFNIECSNKQTYLQHNIPKQDHADEEEL